MSHELEQKKIFDRKHLGLWVYLMTDCILFATLFAVFVVLKGATAGGPSGADIFDLDFVLIETLLLLTSSLTIGIAVMAARKGSKRLTLALVAATFLLGAIFLGMELWEFNHLIAEGYGWQRSAFLSAFFVLVATHGLHILVGLLWIIVVWVRLIKKGFTRNDVQRLTLLGLFWHFLDVIWIFVFSIVYLIGGLA